MTPLKIMIIRHAEKPKADGTDAGVSPEGVPDPEELTVRGWQRSGALIRFFAPVGRQFSHVEIVTPDLIFASAVAHHSKSLRPHHTVLALADFLGQKLVLKHPKGDEDALVADVLSRSGAVLIAWEHEAIPGIANQILGNATTCPQKWPGDRFDLVWVFNPTGGGGWTFTQIPELLLPDDRDDVIPVVGD
jgi:hypothetical protein